METVQNIMANRLSYSQLRLYQECSQKYKYSYVDRIRETTKSGALFFGTAIDKSIEAVLQNPAIDEKAVFDGAWARQELNKKMTYLPDSTLVVYANSDMDWDLLKDEDDQFLLAKLAELCPELGDDPQIAFERCLGFKKQKAFRNFRESENKYLNLCYWSCLRRKGHLMLDAHRKEVLPKITKVIGTQVKVELGNGNDTLLGFADLVCEYLGDSKPIIFDYKTSSIEYAEDSARTSPQLTIYSHALGIRRVGYIVFRKGILKNKVKKCSACGFDGTGSRAKTCTSDVSGGRCGGDWIETISPSVNIQIITDDVPEQTENVVIENVDMINKAISAGIFFRNFDSCEKPYGSCPYKPLCFKNKMDGLEKL